MGSFKIALAFGIFTALATPIHSQTLKCGEREVAAIDLSPQFGQFKDQGILGTCYAETGTQLAEAARFRAIGDKRAMASGVLAASYCANSFESQSSSIARVIKEYSQGAFSVASLNGMSILEGGQRDVVNEVARLSRLPEASEDSVLAYKDARRKASGDFDHAIIAAAKDPACLKSLKDLEDLTAEEKLRDAEYQKEYDKFQQMVAQSGTTATTRKKAAEVEVLLQKQVDVVRKLSNTLDKIAAQKKETVKTLSENVFKKVHDQSCDAFRCYVKSALLEKTVEISKVAGQLIDVDPVPADTVPCSPAAIAQNLKKVMNNLCLGVPLYAGFGPTSFVKFESPGERRQTIVTGHAMVAMGVGMHNGINTLIMRDSGGKDSYAYLPVTELCRIRSLSALLNTEKVDGEPASEAAALGAAGTPDLWLKLFEARQHKTKYLNMEFAKVVEESVAEKKETAHVGVPAEHSLPPAQK